MLSSLIPNSPEELFNSNSIAAGGVVDELGGARANDDPL